MSELTRPEMAAERHAARRIRKRMNLHTKKEGKCSICVHRDRTFGIWHCQNTPDRQFPKCEKDNGVGRFTFDAKVIDQFRDKGET